MLDLEFYATWVPFILRGIGLTLLVGSLGIVLGFALGLGLALLGMAPSPLVRRASALLVIYLRGVPPLVLLFLIYYGLPGLGIQLDAVTASVVALGINESAFAAEIFRSGIEAVPQGQVEAARALGLKRRHIWPRVILPQALRIVVPPLTNDAVGVMKNSSLASTITVQEISLRATGAVSATFRPFEIYAVLATVYVVLALIIAWAGRLIERSLGPEAAVRGR